MITASHNPGRNTTASSSAAKRRSRSRSKRGWPRFATKRSPATSNRPPATRERSRSETSSTNSPITAFPSSTTSRRSSRSRSRSTPATEWPAKPYRASSARLALRSRTDVLRTRRHRSPIIRRARSNPRTWSTCKRAVREHGCDLGVAFDGDADRMFLVDEQGAADRRRHRHRAGRHRHDPAQSGCEDPLQPHLQPQRPGGDRAGRRRARALESRALLHQEDDARRRHPVRRRTFGPFLLQAQLVRGFRHDRADAMPQRLLPRYGTGVERHRADRPALPLGRDQLGRRRHHGHAGASCSGATPMRRSTLSTASRSSTRIGG